MEQVQQVQQPAPIGMNQPQVISTNQMPAKKSGWLKWIIIILVVLILGLGAWWLFTP